MQLTPILLTIGLAVAIPILADPPQGKGNGNNDKADDDKSTNANCSDMPTAAQLKAWLKQAPDQGGSAGGLFLGKRMWGAIVNKDGELCTVAVSTDDPRGVWPGSQAIAKAKAFTANAFSLDDFALSTARLYTFTQPGHSLHSLGQSNPFNPDAVSSPQGQTGKSQVVGGMIFFGGGVPLYKAGKIIGGLGVSGDTSCADHEIAKRVRNIANLNPPGGALADDIVYSATDLPSAFAHPTCLNTFRNGTNLGQTEKPAAY